MNDQKNFFAPLSLEQLNEIQKENPEIICLPTTQEEIDAASQAVKKIKAEEELYPILKQTDETLQFFKNKMELRRSQNEFIEQLEYTPVTAAIQDWLQNLSTGTRRNYAYYIENMIRRSIIPRLDGDGKDFTVGHFREMPHELIIDHIKQIEQWSEGTRQLYAAVYISFTGYLERISRGWFRKAQPSTLASNPTFYAIRDKVATEALTLSEWQRFVDQLTEINERDSLIARALLHGAKRVSEVISIKLDQIDWDKNIIKFKQSKTGGMFKVIPISYPKSFMDELKIYLESTAETRKDSPYVFITRRGKVVTRLRLNYSFDVAGKKAKLKIKVTPHVLRATWVTLVRGQGASDSQIMKVTGHMNNKMIIAYDKTSDEQNLSKEINFI